MLVALHCAAVAAFDDEWAFCSARPTALALLACSAAAALNCQSLLGLAAPAALPIMSAALMLEADWALCGPCRGAGRGLDKVSWLDSFAVLCMLSGAKGC